MFSGRIESLAFLSFLCAGIGALKFINGYITRIKWIATLSIGWFAAAFVMPFISPFLSPLVMAVSCTLFELIPGIFIFLSRKNKRVAK
jgi:hypothetical protein